MVKEARLEQVQEQLLQPELVDQPLELVELLLFLEEPVQLVMLPAASPVRPLGLDKEVLPVVAPKLLVV